MGGRYQFGDVAHIIGDGIAVFLFLRTVIVATRQERPRLRKLLILVSIARVGTGGRAGCIGPAVRGSKIEIR